MLLKTLTGAAVALALLLGPTPAQEPTGSVPDDVRLEKLRTLDDYFPFRSVKTPSEWKDRAARLRRQVLVATGLWPMPKRTPLKAVVHGKTERAEYTVEKVYFQSFPGHFVTGSLYRPKTPAGNPGPGILCPHGHWGGGRYHDHGEVQFKKELASGAETHDPGGRHPLQARCVQLARMGCTVFHYDMVGYADSIQLPHRAGVRESVNTDTTWGLFSPQAELYMQNSMGLQTWNSIRALDFLLGLDGIDPQRIGVTGASGGGTQTFMLGAVDDRPDVLFPAVMVSTAMQGGCTCENAAYLRVGAGNIDLAALAAPRPLGVTGADDWTKEIETKGGADLKKLYAMLGHPDRVSINPYLQFGHNYNAVSRKAMYEWMNRHLKLNQSTPITEKNYVPLTKDEIRVWNDEHPAPSGDQVGEPHERALLKHWHDDISAQISSLTVGSPEYTKVIGGGWETIVGRRADEIGKVEFTPEDEKTVGAFLHLTGRLRNRFGEEIPVLFLYPGDQWNGAVVVWVGDKGKASLLDGEKPGEPASGLLEKGYAVAGIDLFLTGDFVQNGNGTKARLQIRGEQAWQKAACYTFGYNHPLFVQRIHDVMTLVHFIKSASEWTTETVHLVGTGQGGPVALAARTQLGTRVDRCAVQIGGFRFGNVRAFDDPGFVPGAARYLDVDGLIGLCDGSETLFGGERDAFAADAVGWLLK